MFRALLFFSMLVLLLSTGCSPERKLARKYIKNHKGNAILIIPLYDLYKDNLTISYDTNVSFSEEQFDSIAWEQSVFIKHISDSVFLTSFTNSLIDELSASGYDVYLDGSLDVFLSKSDPKWMVQIAQLQLNEDYRLDNHDRYSVETGEFYGVSFRINQVDMSSWIEVSRANSGNKQVLYLEGYIQDDFNQGIDIDLMAGNLGLNSNRDSIEVVDMYRMAHESGQKHAELLLDYFMNDYIRANLPTGIVNREFYHYNRRTKSFTRGLDERFDVIN